MKLFLPGMLVIACVPAAVLYARAQPPTQSTATDSATPRRADGHPDLNGVYTQLLDAGPTSAGKVTSKDLSADGKVLTSGISGARSRLGGLYSAEQDGRVMSKGDRNKPMYKPEYWVKVRDMELHSQARDPEFHCAPWGVPRMGQPQQIFQQDKSIVFLYSGAYFGNHYRVIAMNRPHDPDRVAQETSLGDAVGHWEGDTLIVDTTGFDDETWLGALGYIHSTSLHVIERFTRQGNQIKYEVTVEDPEMLVHPWVWAPRTMALNPDPNAMLPEVYPCSERDVQYSAIR